jgi:hypothetical protein
MAEPIKDRSNIAALAITLEAIVMALARVQCATLDEAGKAGFAKEISANVDAICGEIAALAPAAGRSANLSSSAAKAAAARIHRDALDLSREFMADLLRPSEAP